MLSQGNGPRGYLVRRDNGYAIPWRPPAVPTIRGCDDVLMEPQTLRVLTLDGEVVGDFQALSYTVFADGDMEVSQADGNRLHFAWDEWIDVQWLTVYRPEDEGEADWRRRISELMRIPLIWSRLYSYRDVIPPVCPEEFGPFSHAPGLAVEELGQDRGGHRGK